MDNNGHQKMHLQGKAYDKWILGISSAYILNRCLTKSGIPQEAWSGKIYSVSHIRIFRCETYSRVPTKKMYFYKLKMHLYWTYWIGKSLKLYNSIFKNVILRKNVEFKEEEFCHRNIHGSIKVAHH